MQTYQDSYEAEPSRQILHVQFDQIAGGRLVI